MTTFTMQDLTPTQQEQLKKHEELHATYQHLITDTPTREEEEAMDTLAKQQESNAVLETIQGASGAQYTPIDFKQFEGQTNESKTLITAPPTVLELTQQLTQSFATLINAILDLQTQADSKQAQPMSEGLEETVDVVLQNADWFANKVDEKLDELIDDHDFDYEIERAVENHFGDFCLEDHVDVSSEIESIVDDRLDEMVQEKVEEILREKLSTATISFN